MTTVGRNNHSCLILDFRYAVIKVFLLFLHTLPYAASQMENELAPPDQLGPQIGPKFNPLMAIIMVILVSAFFVMGFFSVYIRQCAERRSRPGWDPATAIGAVAPRSWRIARGLEASVIETFPTFLYSTVKGHKIGKNALECAVCLNEFKDDETLRMIPKCNHVFHPDCIDAWLSSHTTCPVCRANLDPKPGEEVPCATVQIPDPGEPDQGPENNGDTHNHGVICGGGGQTRELGSPDLNITTSSPGTSQITPRKITGWRLTGLFPRSHSTGHSLVQPGENCERFTLRLPEDVRSRLMNSTLPRTKSCVAFQRARSSRRSYRSGSLGSGPGRSFYYYERFEQEGRPDRWGFSMTPPFFSKSGSVRSQRVLGDGSSNQVCASPPKALFKSAKTTVRS